MNNILFVFEGTKMEPNIFSNLQNFFFEKKDCIKVLFGKNILKIYKELSEDSYLDTIELLRDFADNNKELDNLTREDVSEIHLFFDYDFQNVVNFNKKKQEEYNEIILKMLKLFNNENDKGKLWISYPMVEAIKHIKKDIDDCFFRTLYPIKQSSKYKYFINSVSDFIHLRHLDEKDWGYIVSMNIQKLFCIIKQECYLPKYDDLKKHIDNITIDIHKNETNRFFPKDFVATLSAIPIFLIYYLGENFYKEIAEKFPKIKSCKFSCLTDIEVQ